MDKREQDLAGEQQEELLLLRQHFRETWRFDVITDDINALKALDYLWNGVYYFEKYDLSNAYRLELYTH